MRTKVYAIILGTVGVGLASQLFSFSGLIISVGTAGIPLGLTTFVSIWEKEGNWTDIKETMAKFTIILFLLGLLFLGLTITFSEEISMWLLDSTQYSSFLILTAVSFPFAAITPIYDACLRGLKEFNKYVKLSVTVSIISLITSIVTVLIWGLPGLPYSLIIPAVLSLGLYMFLFNKFGFFEFKDFRIFNLHISESLKMILKIGAASLFDLFLHQVVLIVMRSTLIKHLGISSNGIYQVINVISNNYISIFFMSLWVYVLPILSEMKNVDEINTELNSILRFTLYIIFPIIGFTFIFREYIVMLLFTSKFSEASDFLLYSFVGDFIRAISWVVSAWLIPKSKLKQWLSLGIVFNIFYFSVFTLLINYIYFDIRSIVIAYAVANAAHLCLSYYYSKKINNFKIRPDVLSLLIITTLLISLVFICSTFNLILGYIVIIPIMIVWFKLCVKKNDMTKLFQLIGLGSLIKSKS